MLFGDYEATQDRYEATEVVALNSLPDAMPELTLEILAPLYELFGLFALPKRLIEEELKSLRGNIY
jgi:hypothetical protein